MAGGAERTDVAVAHVIDENDNEVRLQAGVLLRLERAGAEEERTKKQAVNHHLWNTRIVSGQGNQQPTG